MNPKIGRERYAYKFYHLKTIRNSESDENNILEEITTTVDFSSTSDTFSNREI